MPFKPLPLCKASRMVQDHATSLNNLLSSTSAVQLNGKGHEIANHVLVFFNSKCK